MSLGQFGVEFYAQIPYRAFGLYWSHICFNYRVMVSHFFLTVNASVIFSQGPAANHEPASISGQYPMLDLLPAPVPSLAFGVTSIIPSGISPRKEILNWKNSYKPL